MKIKLPFASAQALQRYLALFPVARTAFPEKFPITNDFALDRRTQVPCLRLRVRSLSRNYRTNIRSIVNAHFRDREVRSQMHGGFRSISSAGLRSLYSFSGIRLIRLPVALNTALATAGARGVTPGSPIPPMVSGSLFLTTCTLISGISLMRMVR